MSDDRIKSKLGYEYSLKDALRHNPTIIMAGDNISAVALARIEELEAQVEAANAVIAAERAEVLALRAKLAKAVEVLGEAIYLLDPDEEDIAKETGLYRIVTTYAELKGDKDE